MNNTGETEPLGFCYSFRDWGNKVKARHYDSRDA